MAALPGYTRLRLVTRVAGFDDVDVAAWKGHEEAGYRAIQRVAVRRDLARQGVQVGDLDFRTKATAECIEAVLRDQASGWFLEVDGRKYSTRRRISVKYLAGRNREIPIW